MSAELVTQAAVSYGLPGLILLGLYLLVSKAIEKKYEFRIGPKQ